VIRLAAGSLHASQPRPMKKTARRRGLVARDGSS
jgi:hypothetical protein